MREKKPRCSVIARKLVTTHSITTKNLEIMVNDTERKRGIRTNQDIAGKPDLRKTNSGNPS